MAECPVTFENSKSIQGWERSCFERSITCLMKELEGHYTTVELRNETEVTGKTENVDGFMNIVLSDVTYTKPNTDPLHFPLIHIHGRQIRYVHIPDQINMRRGIVNQLDKFRQDWGKYGTKVRKGYVARKKKEREAILSKVQKVNNCSNEVTEK